MVSFIVAGHVDPASESLNHATRGSSQAIARRDDGLEPAIHLVQAAFPRVLLSSGRTLIGSGLAVFLDPPGRRTVGLQIAAQRVHHRAITRSAG
jgi:hypothetical protein